MNFTTSARAILCATALFTTPARAGEPLTLTEIAEISSELHYWAAFCDIRLSKAKLMLWQMRTVPSDQWDAYHRVVPDAEATVAIRMGDLRIREVLAECPAMQKVMEKNDLIEPVFEPDTTPPEGPTGWDALE